jgi:hypothetical protein
MASFLNEELMGTNLDIPEGEIKIDGKVNPVYADAINVHNKKKKEREKILKDKKPELKKPFLGTKGSTTIMPKTKEMKKLKLSEDLFKNEATATMDRKSWELQDKRNNKDVWSDIYNELVDMKDLETPHRRMGKQNRYKGSWEFANPVRVGASRDGGIVVKAEELSDLDFAKEVAETYGVEWRMKEHTSRYADAKFELFIYPYNQVVTESLTESVDNEIYSAVVKRFDYGAPADFVEVLADLVDRALMNKDEGYDTDEAIQDAIDSGLIYHKDIWTIKSNYEDSLLSDETYESLFNDIYGVVNYLSDNDVDEGLTSAQRYNRKMDKIFNDKKNRDADMVKFIKANSDTSDEEIKKAQDDDKVSLLLKNKGLHDKYWNKNESLNESYTEVDTIECGEEVYKVVYGGVDFNKEKLVPVEDKDGNRTKLYFSDMIEFYTWYDKKGNVIHEPSEMDESLNEDLKPGDTFKAKLPSGNIETFTVHKVLPDAYEVQEKTKKGLMTYKVSKSQVVQ